jgi:hypothetical protein
MIAVLGFVTPETGLLQLPSPARALSSGRRVSDQTVESRLHDAGLRAQQPHMGLSLRVAIAEIDFFGSTSIVRGQLTINGDWSGLVTNLSFCCSIMIDEEGSALGEINVLSKIALWKRRHTVVEVQWSRQ